MVGGIGFNCDLGVWDPMGEDQHCGKSLFKGSESQLALIGEVPSGTILGEACEWHSDFGVSINEVSVEVGKTKERLNVFDLPGFRPILDNLDSVWCHGEAFG